MAQHHRLCQTHCLALFTSQSSRSSCLRASFLSFFVFRLFNTIIRPFLFLPLLYGLFLFFFVFSRLDWLQGVQCFYLRLCLKMKSEALPQNEACPWPWRLKTTQKNIVWRQDSLGGCPVSSGWLTCLLLPSEALHLELPLVGIYISSFFSLCRPANPWSNSSSTSPPKGSTANTGVFSSSLCRTTVLLRTAVHSLGMPMGYATFETSTQQPLHLRSDGA